MAELEFARIEITDKERADECLKKSGFRGCEYTFGNNFVWRNFGGVEVAFSHGMFFCRQLSGGKVMFLYPAGEADVKTAVELLREYCNEQKIELLISANREITGKITALYHNARALANRDFFDYVYLAEDLENLSGKKYHGKRNHLNRFYENDWSFEPLTMQNIPECLEMNEKWRAENIDKCSLSEEARAKSDELCVVECSLKYYDKLGYTGGVLRVNGEVQAFTFGEPAGNDCFVVHVEKALREFQGAYTAVNREFVKSLGGRYKYINREDDTGSENLRKAKLSYHPAFMEEKYIISFGG